MRLEGVTVETDPVDLAAITLRLSLFEEAVVVTATRIEELLQQVPMSVSAVTGADLERRAIGNLTELAALDARPDGCGPRAPAAATSSSPAVSTRTR